MTVPQNFCLTAYKPCPALINFTLNQRGLVAGTVIAPGVA